VHLQHPVPEAVGDQAQRVGPARVEGVPGAGVVEVVAGVGGQPVVRRVVEALQAQQRALVVPFGGVVEHDVEDHLDARRVESFDQLLELDDLLADVAR